ncbi:MAG: hypothetical protein AAB728_04935, partial [Patescibacteria group bacterium]
TSEGVCNHAMIENDDVMKKVTADQCCVWAKVNDVLGSMTKEGFVPAPDQTAEDQKQSFIALASHFGEFLRDVEKLLKA